MNSAYLCVPLIITLENGQSGTGYTYTGGKGGQAILAMIKYDLAPALIGIPQDIRPGFGWGLLPRFDEFFSGHFLYKDFLIS